MFPRKNTKRRPSLLRRGAATVELAVCLPILSLIALGSFEAASMIFLRQAVVQSAYECCKQAIKPNGSEALARVRANEVLGFRNIVDETIIFEPNDVENVPRGDAVRVTITCPGDSNSIIPFGPFQARQISVSATMVKE